jgi:hypothetical protein
MESETKTNTGPGRKGGGRAYHSRVEPFVAFIREQRQKRQTWREIAEWLAVEKDCRITLQGLYQFYRRYVERQGKRGWEEECNALPVPPARPNDSASSFKPARKPVLAEIPAPRSFRQPNLENLKLNDPTI